MKIALIQCPAFGIDRPPLGLGYLSAVLRPAGYDVEIFDLNCGLYAQCDSERRLYWDFRYVYNWQDNDWLERKDIVTEELIQRWSENIAATAPDAAGFSMQSSSLETSLRLARRLKTVRPQTTIIFGGPLHLTYSIEHAYYLLGLETENGEKIADHIVLGEGEQTLPELLNRIETGKEPAYCPGTVGRDGDSIVNNGPRPSLRDLDSLPFPDFSSFRNEYKFKNRFPILASRGCVYRCVFCDDVLFRDKYCCRSAEHVAAEMEIRKKQGAEFLEFNDLLINGDLRQLSRMCDLLIKKKTTIHWGASACVDRRMNLRLLRKLRRSGCVYLNYGIESAAKPVLKSMNKSFTIESAQRIIEDTHKAGITVCTNWIVGFPAETEDDFEATLGFIRKNMKILKGNIMLNSFILKGNSFIFKNRKRFGIVSDNRRNWYAQDGRNSAARRQEKFERFMKLLEDAGDSPAHETFHD